MGGEEKTKQFLQQCPPHTIIGDSLMKLNLVFGRKSKEKKEKIDQRAVLKHIDQQCIDQYLHSTTEDKDIESAKELTKGLKQSKEEKSPLLVFLGTGSAIPSKYRNVTGI